MQTKFFIGAVILFVVAVLFGGIQTCRLSNIERASGKIADQNKRLADQLDVLKGDMADTSEQLEGAQVVVGSLQAEISRIRDLYRGSETHRRELAERLAEFERIIESSDAVFEQGERRFDELETGLRDAQTIIRGETE